MIPRRLSVFLPAPISSFCVAVLKYAITMAANKSMFVDYGDTAKAFVALDRPKYRAGTKETAVKVYTINNESR